MIYVTGDTHGMIDWEKINTREFPEQKSLTRDDYVIVLGDFGGIWDGAEQDRHILKTYGQRNFTTLFIDGNHENHDLLDAYPVEEWNGGKIHRISDNVIHLMRGQVFTVEGMKLFAMGGAESTDREWRKEGESWWAREMPSKEEYAEAVSNLETCGGRVDLMLTHCAPEATVCALNMQGMYCRRENELTLFFDELAKMVKFSHWFFGHYHRDADCGKYSLVYDRILKVEKRF